jgi:Pyruvate/2-oxoacid:ferredoxin oxidoreductase delta subunit
MFDMPIDYESLSESGTIMGSGGMIVLDQQSCMVDVAKYFTNFLQEESCGKCSVCREGTQRMHEILSAITEGRGKVEDLELLEELGTAMREASMCGLGQTAPNPVLSTIRYFRKEYMAHILDKKCPGGVCASLVEYSIDAEQCNGCHLCNEKCPEEAISGEPKSPHTIDQNKCTKCGICMDVCKKDAITVT